MANKERGTIPQQEKKKSLANSLYYGVAINKNGRSKSKAQKSALKERQKKAAQDRAKRPWNQNSSYVTQLSQSPQRRWQRNATSLSKSKSSFFMSTYGNKNSKQKKYKSGQFGTKSQFGALGKSVFGVGNRYGLQNNLAGKLKRSSTLSTFQPKFGKSTIGTRSRLNAGTSFVNEDEDSDFKKSIEWRRQVAAKYNNFMKAQSRSPTKKTKSDKLSGSPVRRASPSKLGESMAKF